MASFLSMIPLLCFFVLRCLKFHEDPSPAAPPAFFFFQRIEAKTKTLTSRTILRKERRAEWIVLFCVPIYIDANRQAVV